MGMVLMAGDHPRHSFIARCLAKTNLLSGLIIERREAFVPKPPDGLNDRTKELFIRHFATRASTEERFFSSAELPYVETLVVEQSELNAAPVRKFLDRVRPELLMSYGVHKLNEDTLARIEGKRWNIHGGLSPWYRGAITHFGPAVCSSRR